jgi:hypothetical protein
MQEQYFTTRTTLWTINVNAQLNTTQLEIILISIHFNYEVTNETLRYIKPSCLEYNAIYVTKWPIPVAARSVACLCYCIVWYCGFESHRGHGCLSLVRVLC